MDKGRRDRERRNHLLQIKPNPAHPLSLSLSSVIKASK
jgi:hypothetical protein